MDDAVYILPGVSHYETAGFADTWGAYDALSAEDGWVETTTPGRRRWKRGTVNGRQLVVYPPTKRSR